MFDGNVLTRRLRLRRLRRSTVSFAHNHDASVGLLDVDDMLHDLSVWAAGMPWVVESPCGARERLTLFMLDCTPLSCREPWFAITAINDDADDTPGIVVILSDAVADRATLIDGGAGIARIGRQRSITAVGMPTSEQEFEALQQLLEVTYAAAFRPSK
jgi:hypothetical protein